MKARVAAKRLWITLPQRQLFFALAGIFAVSCIGVYAVLQGRAATAVVSQEPEAGTISAPATAISDSAASAGKAVRFGAAQAGDPTLDQSVVVDGLSNPWDIGFLPDGTMLFTERSGLIKARAADGTIRQLLQISDIAVGGEGGLLGMAIDPNFATNRYVYACFSSTVTSAKDNRIARWTVDGGVTSLGSRTDIVTGITYNASRHNGCRPRFGSDGYLWIGTGDAAIGTNPQNKMVLNGKVLRVDRNGAAAPGNAGAGFNPRIYSYGHRNVQGLAFRPNSTQAFSVEHGSSRDDELNLLRPGANYGWDPIPGYDESVPMTDLTKFPSALNATWTSGTPTIAPSGATFLSGPQWRDWNGAVAVAVLKGKQLMVLTLNDNGTAVTSRKTALQLNTRLRSAVQGPDGNLYIATDVAAGGGQIWKIVPR